MRKRILIPLLVVGTACSDAVSPTFEAPSPPSAFLAPAAAANRSAPQRVTMFGALNVGCEGATDVTNPRGALQVRVARGGVRFTVNLKGAEPDSRYTVTASTGGNCSNGLAFDDAIATDSDGNGSFAGLYPLGSGTHAILVTAHTGFGVVDPANRDVGNVTVSVTVP